MGLETEQNSEKLDIFIQEEEEEHETTTETVTETSSMEEKVDFEKGYQLFVYIGPSLPNGKLKSNTILKGGYEEIIDYLGETIEKYPQIKTLIIPINRLGEQLKKVKTPGNIINKYYNDVVSIMRGNMEV